MVKEKEKKEIKKIEIIENDVYIKIPKDYEIVKSIRKLLTTIENDLSEKKDGEIEIIKEVSKVLEPEIPEIEFSPKIPKDNNFKLCPLCNSKLKRKKITQEGDILKQKVICKNRKCNFQKELIYSL